MTWASTWRSTTTSKQPLSAEQLRELIGKLEDPVTDLVRRDPYFRIWA